ncbi:MAG: gamma-glutamyltransferase [Caulobacteraceae bacterium]
MVAYFTKPDGTKYKAGDLLKNPAYAKSLRTIAAEGPEAIYGAPSAPTSWPRCTASPCPGP